MTTVGELKEFLKDFDNFCKIRYDDDELVVYWNERNEEGDDEDFEEVFVPKYEPSPKSFDPLIAYYMNSAVKDLMVKSPFLNLLDKKPLPIRSGEEIQFFNYSVAPEEVK